ncbi:MAG: O-antigen ligase family protein, partial [Caldilineaceae bacterium]|nr:O-antigen ligase family protein [Caldilineaceae bacterium]
SQPNPYAGYLGLTLPVAVSLSIWAWQRTTVLGRYEPRRLEALRWLILTAGAAGLIGLGMLASWSRGGWLGALAGVGFVVIFRSRRALVLGVIGGLFLVMAVAIGGVSPALIPDAIAQRVADVPAYFGVGIEVVVSQPVTDENFSVIERLAHWIAALRMWESHPWVGVGPGNYAVVYPDVRLPRWEDALGHAHNVYLNILAESGLVGLAAYVMFWTLTVVWLWRLIRAAPGDSWEAALRIGVMGVLVHLTVHNFFDNLYVQGMYLHVALWLAACDSPRSTVIQRDKLLCTSGVEG